MRTVLIVDDHPGFRGWARTVRQAEGFGVVGEVADGAAAIQAVRALRPDVVLLDVQLPDMDGRRRRWWWRRRRAPAASPDPPACDQPLGRDPRDRPPRRPGHHRELGLDMGQSPPKRTWCRGTGCRRAPSSPAPSAAPAPPARATPAGTGAGGAERELRGGPTPTARFDHDQYARHPRLHRHGQREDEAERQDRCRQLRYLATLPGTIGSQAKAELPQVTREVAEIDNPAALEKDSPGTVLLGGAGPAYYLSALRYNEVATARSIPQPLLFLQGDRDYQVTVADDLDVW
jgi:Response regulator receiver domain